MKEKIVYLSSFCSYVFDNKWDVLVTAKCKKFKSMTKNVIEIWSKSKFFNLIGLIKL